MKKSSSKTILVVLVMLVMASGAIFAQTTADLTLSGTVASILDISIAEEATADALDLTNGHTNVKVATATVNSNGASGYKISASCDNADVGDPDQARLVGGNTGEFIEYSLTFQDQLVTYSGAFFYTSAANTVFNGVTHDIDITIAAGTPQADTYTDTVTFTIAAQ